MTEKLYSHDLAYIHDVGFGHFARDAAPGILRRMRRDGINSGRVVDLGCGSGIWAAILCDAGYEVWGVDFSSEMIELARRKAPQATFRCESFLRAELPSCRCVTALGEILSYQFDPEVNEDTLRDLFARVFTALQPGGIFVFDVATPGRGSKRGHRHRHWREDDWVILTEVEEDPERAILTRQITAFRRESSLYRRTEEVHRLRLYDAAKLAASLTELGFRVRRLRRYGNLPFPRGLAGIIAHKS
jgi:SAM-dependent methyltransferase